MSETNSPYKGNKAEEVDDFSAIRTTSVPEKEPEQVSEPEPQIVKKPVTEYKHVKKQTSGTLKKALLVAAVVLAVVVIGITVFGATVPQDKILGGIKISDIDLGGKTKEDAVNLLSSKSGPYIDSEVIIHANNKRFVVDTEEIDANIDVEATVEKAFSEGKGTNLFANAAAAVKWRINGSNFLPVITYNEEKFAQKINEIGIEAVGSQLVEHSVRFADDGKAYVVPGTSGYNNNPEPVMEMIKTALLEAESNEIEVKFEKTKPAKLTIDALDAFMYKSPVNASFALENGKVIITESEQGRFIDKEQCKQLLSMVGEGKPEVEIPYKVSEPEIKADDLKGKLFNAELASYSTRYAAGGNRGSNVNNAAAKINGTIILPGETFSFNKTVGKRTVANGFKPAPEYQNGQTVTGIGGGTCQVSTTVYSAALYADLKIVKRSNHSMSVSYVPLGQDATVTDGGIDLQFMNDTAYPIKIKTVTGGGKLTVTIIGTAPDVAKSVKINHSSVNGGVRTTRVVYDSNGNVIKKEDMGLSKYKPHAESSDSGNAEATEAPAEATEAPVESTEAPAAELVPPIVNIPDNQYSEPVAPPPTQAPQPEEPSGVVQTTAPVVENTPQQAPAPVVESTPVPVMKQETTAPVVQESIPVKEEAPPVSAPVQAEVPTKIDEQ